MSIINQMLKDIDRRDRDGVKQGRAAARYSGEVQRPRPLLWASLGSLLAIVVVLGAYYTWQQLSGPTATESTTATTEPVPELPVAADDEDSAEAETDTDTDTTVAESATTTTQASETRERPRSEGGRAPTRPQALERGQPLPTSLASDTQETNSGNSAGGNSTSADNNETRHNETVTDDNDTQNSAPQTIPEGEVSKLSAAADQPAIVVPDSGGSMRIERSDLSPERQAERLFERAMEALQQNNHRQARQRFHEVLLVKPEHSEAREQLAAHYYGQGFLSDAMEVLEAGLSIDPKDYDLLLLQARILESAEQPREALELIRGVPYELPELVDLLILKGSLALDLEEYPLAANTYQALTGWRSHQGRWWLGLAMAREELAEYDRAEQAYQRALGDGRLPTEVRDFILDRLEGLTN